MLKQRFVKLAVALAVVAILTGASGIVADTLEMPLTSPAFACPNSSSSGGGC